MTQVRMDTFGMKLGESQDGHLWHVVLKGLSMNYGFKIKEMAQVAKGGKNIPL